MRIVFAIVLGQLLAFSLHAPGQLSGRLKLANTIRVGEAQRFSFSDLTREFDRHSLAVTPQGDILVLSAERSGIWKLMKVSNWNSDKPIVQTLDLPGYFSTKNRKDLEQLKTGLYVAADRRIAICIGDALWIKRINGVARGNARSDDIITSVDLVSFRKVSTVHTASLMHGEFSSERLDENGKVVVTSSNGATSATQLVSLSIPGLSVESSCELIPESPPGNFRPIDVNKCMQLTHGLAIDTYLRSVSAPATRSKVREQNYICTQQYEYCPDPVITSRDSKYAIGSESEGHDTLFGGYSETAARAVLFSLDTHRQVGAINIINAAAGPVFAQLAGRDYVAVLTESMSLDIIQIEPENEK